jgi:cytochrome c oxidase subunit 2
VLNSIRGLALGLLASFALASAAPAQAPAPPAVTGAAPATVASAPTNSVSADKPADIVHAVPTPGIGQPTQAITLESQETAIGQEAARFHDYILVPMMAIISAFVLALLLWVIWRYRAAKNPVPSKTHHNTLIEIIWTLAPVLILVAIAVPSIRLLAHQYSPPKADLTVKVIGNQWYWTYQYPDNGDIEIVSNMLKEKAGTGIPGRQTATGKERARTEADGPALLAVDERMVVPVGAVVKIITTSNDVIHSFSLPAAWTKMDAIPGRLNETWFKIDRPGVYFGQCSELCGARHGYMPIAVEVVSKEKFAQWIAFKGGTMPGAKPAATPETAAPAAAAATPAPVATDTPVAGTGSTPPVTSQPAVAQN